MKKLIILSIIVFCISSFVQAQVARFGIDGGVAISRGKYTPFDGDRRVYVGFDGGAFIQLGQQRIKFHGEVNYTMIGVELNNFTSEHTIKHRYITVPLLAKVRAGKFHLLTGFQAGFLLSSKTDSSGAGSADVKEQFKNYDYSWVFGAEIPITQRIFFAVRYTLGLTNIANRLNFEMQNRYLSLRVGYALAGKNK
jgi:hypothetical protein